MKQCSSCVFKKNNQYSLWLFQILIYWQCRLAVRFILITLCYYTCILQISCNFTCTTGSWCVAEATPPDTWNTLWTSWLPLPSCLSHGPSPANLISHRLRLVNSNPCLAFSMRHPYEWIGYGLLNLPVQEQTTTCRCIFICLVDWGSKFNTSFRCSVSLYL